MGAMRVTLGGREFEEVVVAGPPDCFFLAVQVHEAGKTIAELRALAADYMVEHSAEYTDFQDETDEAFDTWVEKVRSTEWAEHRVVDALQLALRREIHVYNDAGGRWPGLKPRDHTVTEYHPIRVLYNGHNHYSGLREATGIDDIDDSGPLYL